MDNTSALPKLEPRRHHRIDVTQQEGAQGIRQFGFLPGGRYLMIAHRNGVFACWDILQGSGVKLAEHRTAEILGWNFHMTMDNAGVIVVLVTRRWLNEYWLVALRYKFSQGDAVPLELEELATIRAPFACPMIQIQDGHIWSPGYLGDDQLLLFVWNFIDKCHVLINTGIRHFPAQWDSFSYARHGIMLYREDAGSAYTYWYDSATTLLEEVPTSDHPDMDTTESSRLRRPDGDRVYNFAEDCILGGHRSICFVAHALGTPNYSHDTVAPVSVLSISRGHHSRPGASQREAELAMIGMGHSHLTITQHWFNPGQEIYAASLNSPGKSTDMRESSSPLHRWIHHIPGHTGPGGRHIPCIGSHGTHMLWLRRYNQLNPQTNEQEQETFRLSIATLLPMREASDLSEIAIRDVCVERGAGFGLNLEDV
ncbi:hypothetical protein FRB94_002107 [Tulasnella sp. JGI-2019a]|nr:hypothetical protein FRB94_002107 [Tulasnella sp. JGI-2019a]